MLSPCETWKAKPNPLLRSPLKMRVKQRTACLLLSFASVWFGLSCSLVPRRNTSVRLPNFFKLMMHGHKTNSRCHHGGAHEQPLIPTLSAAPRVCTRALSPGGRLTVFSPTQASNGRTLAIGSRVESRVSRPREESPPCTRRSCHRAILCRSVVPALPLPLPTCLSKRY